MVGGGSGEVQWNAVTQKWETIRDAPAPPPAAPPQTTRPETGPSETGPTGAGPWETAHPGAPDRQQSPPVPPAPAVPPSLPPLPPAWPGGPDPQALPPQEPPPPHEPRQKKPVPVGVVVAMVVAVAVAGAGGGWLLARGPGPSGAASPPARSSAKATSAPSGSGGGGPSASPSPSPSASGSPGAGVPAGFRLAQDPGGFRLYVPQDWTRTEQGKQGVFYTSQDGARLIQVYPVTEAGLSPYEALRRTSGALAANPGYEEIGLTDGVSVPGIAARAARLVYAYDKPELGHRRQVVDYAFLTPGGKHFAVLSAAPADAWPEQEGTLKTALSVFCADADCPSPSAG
ncbi:hypothetical protein [Streptomyces sp. NPDC048111]|uniref:hypothetical protein n=1 Tax=Streptomyces sp. NPDC048111 TaxID=3365500 RepID=UPI003710D6D7